MGSNVELKAVVIKGRSPQRAGRYLGLLFLLYTNPLPVLHTPFLRGPEGLKGPSEIVIALS